MSNSRFINALNRRAQITPPIWFMRQAGRYHSHYQNLKKSYTFEELCKTPKLAAETAIGKYPVEAVTMIRKLIEESEAWTPDVSLSEFIGA